MTPEAPTAAKMCSVLADARRFKLEGHWSGSAYRHHPCGVIRDGLIFTNEWNTHNYCSVKVMLDPTSPIKPIFNSSRHNGDPGAYPERGGTLTVYNTGRWTDDDGPWREKILHILSDLEAEITEARASADRLEAERQEQIRAAHNAKVEAARTAIRQGQEQP